MKTDGQEAGAEFAVSPDGNRVLITGNTLRMYDAKGWLLREIQPPEGASVLQAAWSKDGRSFAYTTGPSYPDPL